MLISYLDALKYVLRHTASLLGDIGREIDD
jgi:hypothetical protein